MGEVDHFVLLQDVHLQFDAVQEKCVVMLQSTVGVNKAQT